MYAEDLAYIQHVGFGDFSSQAAPGLSGLLHQARITEGTVLDLGCGAGEWLRRLGRAGYTAHGIDSSSALVRIARRTARGATVTRGSIYKVSLPECDAVTALGEVLSYCPASGGVAPALGSFFTRVARSLRPGGLLLFDVLVDGSVVPERTWKAGSGWTVLVESRHDPARRRLVRRIVTFRHVGSAYRRRNERHVLRITPRRDVEALLRAAGFKVRASRYYGKFELMPGRLAFRAQKK